MKLEGGARVVDLVARITEAGIPVMGHVGLTPQSVNQFGGYRVQGKTDEQAHQLVSDAKSLEAAGAFAVVLEAVPAPVAAEVTRTLHIPTIGIGAGPDCDGQVLVWHDFLGITDGKLPRFVKRYAEVGEQIKQAASDFAAEVAAGTYPGPSTPTARQAAGSRNGLRGIPIPGSPVRAGKNPSSRPSPDADS